MRILISFADRFEGIYLSRTARVEEEEEEGEEESGNDADDGKIVKIKVISNLDQNSKK
jgi:hypothetical protein